MDLPRLPSTADRLLTNAYNSLATSEQDEIDSVAASFEKAQKLSELAQSFEKKKDILEACKVYEDVFRLTQDTSILKTIAKYYAEVKEGDYLLKDQKQAFELKLQKDPNPFKIYENYKIVANPNLNKTEILTQRPKDSERLPLLTDQPNFIQRPQDFKDKRITELQVSTITTSSLLNENSSKPLPSDSTCVNFEKAQLLVPIAEALALEGKMDEALKVYNEIFNLTDDCSVLEVIKNLSYN